MLLPTIPNELQVGFGYTVFNHITKKKKKIRHSPSDIIEYMQFRSKFFTSEEL